MALLTALILALVFPAEAQLRNERGCTGKQEAAVAAALPEAKARIADARRKVKEKDAKAAAVGRVMIGGGYNEEEVGGVLDLMAAALSGAVAHCSSAGDKYCGNRAGYVRSDEKGIIHLCPKFFNEKGLEGSAPPPEQRVRTLVHESAHLAHPDISEPGGESYCVVFSCEDSCGSGPRDERTGRDVPARVADNWSHFTHCASGRPPDELDAITASPRKKDAK